MKMFISLIAMVGTMIQPEQGHNHPELEPLAFLVGEWKAVFEAPPEKPGQQITGAVQTRWGVDRAWIDSDFVADAPAGQRYAVHIVVAGNGVSGESTAFAVNTLSPVPIVYEGRVPASDHAVFTGPGAGKWQRVSYRLLDREHLEFLVEEAMAREGPWSRHSRAILTRQPR